jgi:preprotein translocase subunit SecE
MAKDTGVKAPAPRRKTATKPAPARPAAPAAALAPAAAPAAAAAPAKPRTSPGQFVNEVRAEARKISWPSWKETWITSVMVAIMVTFTAVFFLLVDGSLSFLLQQVLRLAG